MGEVGIVTFEDAADTCYIAHQLSKDTFAWDSRLPADPFGRQMKRWEGAVWRKEHEPRGVPSLWHGRTETVREGYFRNRLDVRHCDHGVPNPMPPSKDKIVISERYECVRPLWAGTTALGLSLLNAIGATSVRDGIVPADDASSTLKIDPVSVTRPETVS